MGLSIQQREREIALLRAVAATPGQIRRMIAFEALIVGLVGAAAGLWPGTILGRELTEGLVEHGIAPPNLVASEGWLPIAAAVGGAVTAALLAVLGAGRRAAKVSPTLALSDAAVEPRLLGPGRVIGGVISLAGAAPLLAVSVTTTSPDTAAATSEMTALFLVAAVGFLGPIVARLAAVILGPFARAVTGRRVPGLGEPAHRHATLLVGQHAVGADGRPELHAAVQLDHDRPRRHPRAPGGPGERPLRHGRAPAGRTGRRPSSPAVSLRGRTHADDARPEPGQSDDLLPAAILSGGQGGGFDAGVTAGSLADLQRRHDRARAPARPGSARRGRRPRGDQARRRVPHAREGRGDLHPRAGVRRRAARARARGRPPDRPAARDDPREDRRPGCRRPPPAGPRALSRAAGRRPRVAGRSTDADREANRWLGPLFVAIIFAFTSIAVVNTLTMIALQRGRELGLLQLVGGTRGQVRSMARWEAGLIVTIGLGVGLAIAATALLPLSHALTGSLRPHVPADQLAAILGVSALLALVALALPTRRALRSRPIEAIGLGE